MVADNTESREISQDNAVMDALMQLDDDTRLIMQMYYYEGYSVKEISIMTKLKETSVYMRLSRGRKRWDESYLNGNRRWSGKCEEE